MLTFRSRLRGLCTALAVAVFLVSSAHGQITPARMFCPADGPIPVDINEPRDWSDPRPPAELPEPMAMEVELIRASSGEVIDRREVRPGRVDAAALFPRIWVDREHGALYLQLRALGRRVGAPLVLTAMLAAPPYAPRTDRSGAPVFPPSDRRSPVYCGVRVETHRHVIFETTRGEMRFALRPDAAPNTVWYFSRLVEGGLYDGTAFHTVASLRPGAEPDFVQGGDPTGTGKGGAGMMIDLEESPLPHTFGTLSMARAADPNSASSQFFVCLGGPAAATLNGRYAVFAQLVGGAETLRALAASAVGPDNRTIDPPRIVGARLIDAPPFGEGPPPARDPLVERPSR